MRRLVAVAMIWLPPAIRRLVGRVFLGWEIHPTARIGRSVLGVRHLAMGPHAWIGDRNRIWGLDEVRLGEGASIASRNSITAFPVGSDVFPHSPNRRPVLILGRYAMVTNGHELDCSDRVELGDYARLAGFRSQVLTHSLDLVRDRFITTPVELGARCAVMSGCVLLNGTRVPARSIVSAGSVVTTKLAEELTFYRGNPAEAIRALPPDLAYFHHEGPVTNSAGRRRTAQQVAKMTGPS